MVEMRSDKIGDYIEDDYVGNDVFIPSDAYGSALDALVIACVDIFIVYDQKVFIGKRARYPHADWWLFGGRMRTGERMDESAQRLLKIEAGIEIATERFQYLTTFTTGWKMRAHSPQENGTHTMSAVMSVALTADEFERIKLNDEYDDKRLVEPNILLDQAQYHPAIAQCVYAYQQNENQVIIK